MAVPLADFVVAVGDVSRNELERVCPFPALLDLGPGAARSQSALRWGDDASVQAAARLTRLRASVIRAPVLSLLFLAPEREGAPVVVGRTGATALDDPSLAPEHARFTPGRGEWQVEALCGAGPTSVEGLELRAGQSVGLTGGQEVLLGKRRTLFLTSAELHLLLTLANESMTRLVLPPAGVLLSALQRLVTSPNAPGPSSPPFLLEVPTEGQESPSSFATVAVPPEEMEHALRAGNDRARIYSIVGRDPTLSEVLLGRHDDCDVVLTDASVSKHHARVCRVEDGWELVDLGSQNGTSVRGERVLAHLRVPIHPGDQVHLGSYRCVFLEPEGVRKLLAFLTSRLPH